MHDYHNMFTIELEKLVVRRIDKGDNKIFQIHYNDGEPVNDVNINFMNAHNAGGYESKTTGRKI